MITVMEVIDIVMMVVSKFMSVVVTDLMMITEECIIVANIC